MGSYLQQESDDVPSMEGDMFESNRSEYGSLTDDCVPWNFGKSKNLNSTCQYFDDMYKQSSKDLSFGDQFVFTEDAEDAPPKSSAESSEFADWEAIASTNWEPLASAGCNMSNSDESPQAHLDSQLQTMEEDDDTFLNRFFEDDMGSMGTPFQTSQMFPDSAYRSSSSYENMFSTSGLDDPHGQILGRDQYEFDAMDISGYPLLRHDVTNDLEDAATCSPSSYVMQSNSDTSQSSSRSKAGVSGIKRSKLVADEEKPECMAAVLNDLEGIVFQLSEKTRLCFRDAFYRLATSPNDQSSMCTSSTLSGADHNRYPSPEMKHNTSRMQASEMKERATNMIDRTVANFTFNHLDIGSTCTPA